MFVRCMLLLYLCCCLSLWGVSATGWFFNGFADCSLFQIFYMSPGWSLAQHFIPWELQCTACFALSLTTRVPAVNVFFVTSSLLLCYFIAHNISFVWFWSISVLLVYFLVYWSICFGLFLFLLNRYVHLHICLEDDWEGLAIWSRNHDEAPSVCSKTVIGGFYIVLKSTGTNVEHACWQL